MIDLNHLDDLARRLSDMVPPGLRQSREELQATFKTALQAGLGKLTWSPAKNSTYSARCCSRPARSSRRWRRPWPSWKRAAAIRRQAEPGPHQAVCSTNRSIASATPSSALVAVSKRAVCFTASMALPIATLVPANCSMVRSFS